MQSVIDATKVYRDYQRIVDQHTKTGLYSQTELNYRMYEGNQWYGLESDGERLPFMNFIQPIVKYKVNMVCMNNMSINFSSMNYDGDITQMQAICEHLNKKASQQWELNKMDKKVWQCIGDAGIAGDSYIYFPDGDGAAQVIDNTNICFSNEQSSDIQSQKYIIIVERRFVSEIKKEAKQNGIDENQMSLIQADSDTQYQIGVDAKREVENSEDGKCLSLLKMWKENGTVHFCRATQDVLYQPDTIIDGLTEYPLVGYVWSRKKGSARGIGEVTPLVANQIEYNRNLGRRLINSKMTAYSRLVYVSGSLIDPNALTEIGTALEIKPPVSDIKDLITYLDPHPMSPDAKVLNDELLNNTRDLAGAGDSATGNIDPTQASGTAIIAVRDQASIPLNEAMEAKTQLVEDIANVYFNQWLAYSVNGLEIAYEADGEMVNLTISPDILQELKVHIRIDVSKTTPYDKYAREQSVENALQMKEITFEEYVSALDDDSTAPKGKFEDILAKREALAQQQAEQEAMMAEQLAQQGLVEPQQQAIPQIA